MSYNFTQLASVDSTNSYVKLHLDKLSNRDVVVADTQTEGRGRLKRKWVSSSAKNLYFSIALKDIGDIREVQNITQVGALALVVTLKNYGVIAKIKWPNDVLVSSKKISGILSETVIKGSDLEALVLGVGINLNMDKAFLDLIDQPATSLGVEIEKEIDKQAFLNDFLDIFFAYYDKFLESGFASLRDEWKSHTNLSGKNIIIRNNGNNIKVRVLDINNDGTLKVISKDNIVSTVCCGDIEII